MLLRSASTPLFNSSVCHPVAAAAAPCDQLLSMTTHHSSSPSFSSMFSSSASSPSSSSSSASSRPRNMLVRAQSEGDLSSFQLPEVQKRRSGAAFSNSLLLPSISLEEEAEAESEKDLAPRSSPIMGGRILTSSDVDAGALMTLQLAEGSLLMENGYCAAVSDGSGRSGGGKMCGGGRGADDEDDEGFGLSDGGDGLDAYYARMVKADPRNPLVLGNYAKFLKEVRGDLDEAQEYCERAILAAAGAGVDAGVLSLYADIIWQTSRDAGRAETYFNQALQADPDDCYVAASYAHFLWDAEEEDAETNHHHQHLCHPSSASSQPGMAPPAPPPSRPIGTAS